MKDIGFSFGNAIVPERGILEKVEMLRPAIADAQRVDIHDNYWENRIK